MTYKILLYSFILTLPSTNLSALQQVYGNVVSAIVTVCFKTILLE